MDRQSKIFVAGHLGMVGSAIVRRLRSAGYGNILERPYPGLDLREQQAVLDFLQRERPEYIMIAAARVGGILANHSYPADFLYDNLMIACNLIHGAYRIGVKKLLFLGSSCIYPKEAPQPLREEHLLSGYLERTNEAYALAKISGLKMCEYYARQFGCDFIAAMPCNLYGIQDNYDPENSHVLPALIRKCHWAKVRQEKEIVIWGTGSPLREFLYVDDLAEACLYLLEHLSYGDLAGTGCPFINIGAGEEISIRDLTALTARVVGFSGPMVCDPTRPDGTMRKILDSSRMRAFGWSPKTPLEEGIKIAYGDFLQRLAAGSIQ